MSARRRRRGQPGTISKSSSPGNVVAPPPVLAGVDRGVKAPPPPADAFTAVLEKAAERAKHTLISKGKVGMTLFFVHGDGSTVTAVSLSFRDKQQEEALIRRVREKARAENVSAVLLVAEAKREPRGAVVFSGVAPGVSVSARVDYTFDKEKDGFTLWEMHRLNGPVRNTILDGIFGGPGTNKLR
jgi:hypothetical protein